MRSRLQPHAAETGTATEQKLLLNGIDGRTGGYLVPPLAPAEVVELARSHPWASRRIGEQRSWARQLARQGPRRGLTEGRDPKRLEESGWAVVFPSGGRHGEIREALAPLLARRREQASGADARLYRELAGADGYRPGESKESFIRRHGGAPGPVVPEKLPYYLLLVGGPDEIPFDFQYSLDVPHAVGRLAFATVDEYAAYAESVVRLETGQAEPPEDAVFFGVENRGDRVTRLSAEHLVAPLADSVEGDPAAGPVHRVLGDRASKASLAGLLHDGEPPALLFTASHGVGFAAGDPLQTAHQGALLCADWPGPDHPAAISPDHYFAGDDVRADARIHGLIAFHFACFSAATPEYDEFARRPTGGAAPRPLAERAFISRLPQRLLGHPGGGALAVVGHVERAWGYSFLWPEVGRQLAVFESFLRRLLDGHPVGSAMEYFNQRYAELTADLAAEVEDLEFGKLLDPGELSYLWTARNDARNYAVLGDPAVRLAAGRRQEAGAPTDERKEVDR